MTPLFRKFLALHWLLVFSMYTLLAIGVFAIHSAGYLKDEGSIQSAYERQLLYIALGTVVFFATSLIDYRWVSWGGFPLYLAGLGLSAYALFRGEDIYGKSWIPLGGITFQPSQLAIAGGIIVTAQILGQLGRQNPVLRNPFLKLALVGLACGVPFGIVLLQGDFGSAMVWLPVAAALLLVGNVPFRYMVTVSLLGLMVIPWAYYFGLKPHQKDRITVFADMLRGKSVDTQGSAYAASYIEKAVGSGGFSGKGRLNEKTINNLGFIPKRTAINDFIFAVWAEEMGFRGSMVLLGGFVLIILQGLFIAFHARDVVGRLICVGFVGLIFAHVFQHVGMNLLIMPITGIPLPFISSGGTFVVICMFLCGMMQSIWVHRGNAATRIALAGETPLFGATTV